ncbi:nucleotidyl transferase (plasmid) [Azospirillum brasilense]|uniref:Nucleotidyl transferase n=1 Tax=Azospirillum brasilense TaxID=192 RepID=A0A235H761_AZOBR|nr:nucleotidyl transferase [Azospirillum brasilense]OYD81317.1 nucleotidyl transferase [Azospirillum brasilense]
MRPEEALTDIDVTLLAGGLGSRMRGVSGDTPKVLAPIAGRAFLGHLLDHLAAYGARRVVLCLGHLADRVTAWLAQGDTNRSLDVVCQIEPSQMGSAAALAYIRKDLKAGTVLVMSGDTFLDADLRAFVASHRLSGAEASVLCVEVEDAARFGRVEVGPDSRVRQFLDKAPGRGVINAGVYLFSAAFLDRLAASGASSLTRDVLHKMPPGTLHGHVAKARFIDMGTPESLAVAASVIGGRET